MSEHLEQLQSTYEISLHLVVTVDSGWHCRMYTFIKYTSAFGIIIRHETLTGKVEWLASSFIIRLPANERLTGLLWAGIIIHHTIASSKRLTGLLWAGIIIHHTSYDCQLKKIDRIVVGWHHHSSYDCQLKRLTGLFCAHTTLTYTHTQHLHT